MFKTICADSFPNPVNLTFSRVKIDYSGSNRNEIALTTRITQDSINTPCAFTFIFHNTTAHVFLQYRPATYTTKLSNIFTFIQNQKSNISSLRSKAINIYVERSPVSSSYTVLSEPVCFVLLLFFSSPRSAHTNYEKLQLAQVYFIKITKSNRLAYEKQVSAKHSIPGKSQEKRCVDCSLRCVKAIDWEMAYKLPFCNTKSYQINYLSV